MQVCSCLYVCVYAQWYTESMITLERSCLRPQTLKIIWNYIFVYVGLKKKNQLEVHVLDYIFPF